MDDKDQPLEPTVKRARCIEPRERKSLYKCSISVYAKLHRVHLSPKVNKQAFAPFELVRSNI